MLARMIAEAERWLGVGTALLVLASPVHSQAPERSTPLLTVDFLAVSRDGTPINDLTAGDVTIRIGGRMRSVRTLQLISNADPTSGASDSGAADRLLPPFGTNATSNTGRRLVIAIDNDSFRPGREAPLRQAVDRLIAGLSAHDRLALVTMPYGGIKVPFTTAHESVRRALTSIVGNAPPAETGSALACRTRETLSALRAFLDTLGFGDDPAIIMFIASGLAAPRHDAPATLAPGICELKAELFNQVGVAAGAARAHFYVIQPGDAFGQAPALQRENIAGTGYLGSDNPIEGLEHLAGATGGKMLQLTGSAETALGRVLRETSSHYLVGVDADRNDRSGRSQELEVRVKRSDLEVRARPLITFPRLELALGRAANANEPSPRDMVTAATVFRDLPLRAAAFVSPGPDAATMRITAVVEPVDPDVRITTLMAALFDVTGKAVAHWTATAEDLGRPAIMGAMPAPPGGYRLRVAAVDATGRGGTADYDFDTEVPSSGPLKLGALVLGLSRGGTFVPKLQFANEPVAIAYLDLYGGAAGMPVTARVEIARTPNGPALVAVPLTIEASGENRYVSKGALPIGALPPGDYLVRALVAVEGHPGTRVVRTVRIKR
jgi:VWFA-related protein